MNLIIIGIMLVTFASSDVIKPPVYPLKWGCDNFQVNGVDFSFPGCEVEFEVNDVPKDTKDCPKKKLRRCCNMLASKAVSYGGDCVNAPKRGHIHPPDQD
ncbi:uncharacterized protein PGTG_00523 [Puccinia graminis f. sp. tritici CRL 75-36-700-3]|uniref:Uncharacterized protein n=1 Tax=Puccinia graminis f. sp. tritici (strain CRL 75-36-700-3 / race SCCL) TaxID=418459 RepID=E3JQ93_PUCGT|nr:uncharacterized protein PGTG_00523 [Puccinia graminis f. sp. tritici CRL 75-36-700-3]EFP74567.1 hypothetical protein PGTG_00523 [Puccinia graminis f. sp. tritici CRL 75-36-700-3]